MKTDQKQELTKAGPAVSTGHFIGAGLRPSSLSWPARSHSGKKQPDDQQNYTHA